MELKKDSCILIKFKAHELIHLGRIFDKLKTMLENSIHDDDSSNLVLSLAFQLEHYKSIQFNGSKVNLLMGLLQNPVGEGEFEDVYLNEPVQESEIRTNLFEKLKEYKKLREKA